MIGFIKNKNNNENESKCSINHVILRNFATIGLVPFERSISVEHDNSCRLIFTYKKLIDNGYDRQTLLNNSCTISISSDIIYNIKLYNSQDDTWGFNDDLLDSNIMNV